MVLILNPPSRGTIFPREVYLLLVVIYATKQIVESHDSFCVISIAPVTVSTANFQIKIIVVRIKFWLTSLGLKKQLVFG